MFSNLAHDENPQCNTKHALSKKTFSIACSQNCQVSIKTTNFRTKYLIKLSFLFGERKATCIMKFKQA